MIDLEWMELHEHCAAIGHLRLKRASVPEPSPESCQYGALRLCGKALRSCRVGFTLKFGKNSTNL